MSWKKPSPLHPKKTYYPLILLLEVERQVFQQVALLGVAVVAVAEVVFPAAVMDP
jgi:hypothetical protein